MGTLFAPRGLLLVDPAGPKPRWYETLKRNLVEGSHGKPVEVSHAGLSFFADDDAARLDVAVVALPQIDLHTLIQRLGQRGIRVVQLIGSAHGTPDERRTRRRGWVAAARKAGVRLLGPDRVGVIVPAQGLNAGTLDVMPPEGSLAFLTQSDSIARSIVDWAFEQNIGFSKIVSLGDMAEVQFGDVLDFLATDVHTRAILMHIEAINDARRFMSAARAAAGIKPVIAIKSGRFELSARDAESHTGLLATSDEIYDAAFRRAGIVRVQTLAELFDAANTVGQTKPRLGRAWKQGRLAIAGNGGGPGMLALDELIARGGTPAELASATLDGLRQRLPQEWPGGHPIDMGAEAGPADYSALVKGLTQDPHIDAALVIHSPSSGIDPLEVAQATADAVDAAVRKGRGKILASFVGGSSVRPARSLLAERHVPSYRTPEAAVRAFMYRARYERGQDILKQIPASVPEHGAPDIACARRIIAHALAEGRSWLNEPEALGVLAAYGFTVANTDIAQDVEDAVRLARAIGYPVALKIVSSDILHKSEVGGVVLNIDNEDQLRQRVEEMAERVATLKPRARIDGFVVQAMIRHIADHELFVGLADDPQFGPTLIFGQGGVEVEVIHDTTFALPPLNMHLAREAIAETRIGRALLDDAGAADIVEQVQLALLNISQIAVDIAEVTEIDVNPLLASSQGLMALDASIKIDAVPEGTNPAARFAVRPYPNHLETLVTLRDGRQAPMRPIRPEDAPALQKSFLMMTPEDRRTRLFSAVSELSDYMAARMTQIDYAREMCFVIMNPDNPEELWGGARIAADPDDNEAEFAVSARSDLQGLGIGRISLASVIAYGRTRGIKKIWGTVLAENAPMIGLAKKLGFTVHRDPDDRDLVKVVLDLTKPAES